MPKLTEAELDALEDQLRTDIRQAGCPEGLVDNALDLGLLSAAHDDAHPSPRPSTSRVEQSALFTVAPVEDSELLGRQGIAAPQGLDVFSDPQWDDETDDAYLTALLSK